MFGWKILDLTLIFIFDLTLVVLGEEDYFRKMAAFNQAFYLVDQNVERVFNEDTRTTTHYWVNKYQAPATEHELPITKEEHDILITPWDKNKVTYRVMEYYIYYGDVKPENAPVCKSEYVMHFEDTNPNP